MTKKIHFAQDTMSEAVKHAIEKLHIPSHPKHKVTVEGLTIKISKSVLAKKHPAVSLTRAKKKS